MKRAIALVIVWAVVGIGCEPVQGGAGRAAKTPEAKSNRWSATEPRSTLTFLWTGSRADLDAAPATLCDIELATMAGWISILDEPRSVDRFVTGDTESLLARVDVPPGRYPKVRLALHEASDGGACSRSVRVDTEVEVASGDTPEILLAFDAERGAIEASTR